MSVLKLIENQGIVHFPKIWSWFTTCIMNHILCALAKNWQMRLKLPTCTENASWEWTFLENQFHFLFRTAVSSLLSPQVHREVRRPTHTPASGRKGSQLWLKFLFSKAENALEGQPLLWEITSLGSLWRTGWTRSLCLLWWGTTFFKIILGESAMRRF